MFYMSFQALTALMEHMFYRTNVHHSPPGGHWRTDVLLDAPSMPGPLEAERWFLEQIYEYGAAKKEVEPLFGFLSTPDGPGLFKNKYTIFLSSCRGSDGRSGGR